MYLGLILLSLAGGLNALAPEVVLPTGRVEGHYKTTDRGRIYNAFEGIPYARPPVGKYRFEEPKQIKPWFGTWQAKTLTSCMQYYHYTIPGQDWVRGDEDCLHVNVYTPRLDGDLKPVIVFIHGGAFMFNHGGSYGERYLMNYDVVFVSFNYRLGPLGFLSTESRIVPGNNGLKDQLMALKWVKENIRNFGGNPDAITLTGMSAGGASVHIHSLSANNHDKQLFHRAYAMSGTALNHWVMVEKAREKTEQLAGLVGCPIYDTKEMIKCMRYRPGKQIVAAVRHFQPWRYNPFSPFGVVVDKWSEHPVLHLHPYELLKNGEVQNVPTIFSNVASEGLYPGAEFDRDAILDEIDTRWNDLVPFILDYNNTAKSSDIITISDEIRRFYFNDSKVDKSTYMQLIKMMSDRIFVADIERAARLHSAANRQPTYYYYYTYRAANSMSDKRSENRGNYGAAHGDDTILVLSTAINTTSTLSDRTMSELMQTLWLSFAKSGVPNMNNIQWDKVSTNVAEPLNYLLINSPDDIKMQSAEQLGNRATFWDKLPIRENAKIPTAWRDEL